MVLCVRFHRELIALYETIIKYHTLYIIQICDRSYKLGQISVKSTCSYIVPIHMVLDLPWSDARSDGRSNEHIAC